MNNMNHEFNFLKAIEKLKKYREENSHHNVEILIDTSPEIIKEKTELNNWKNRNKPEMWKFEKKYNDEAFVFFDLGYGFIALITNEYARVTSEPYIFEKDFTVLCEDEVFLYKNTNNIK